MRRMFFFVVIVFFAAVVSTGYTADNVSLEGRSGEVIELLELTGSYKLALRTMIQVMTASRDAYNRNHPNKKISDEVWACILEITMGEIDKASYYKRMVPIYEKHLTKEEVRELIAFYKSDVGKKITSVLPDIMKESLSAAQAWGKDIAQRIRPKIEQKLREMGYPVQNLG